MTITLRQLIAGLIVMALLIFGSIIENWRDRKRMTKQEHDASQVWFLATALGFIVLLVLMGVFMRPAYSHDHTRPELSEWYFGLTGRGPCCDGSETEMKHLSDVEWRAVNGHYQVYINQFMDGSGENLWIDVPDDAVVKGPNRDGRTLVWPIWGIEPRVRCFMPGPMT